MKKLLIVFVAVVIIFLSSLIYKNHLTPILMNFPIKELTGSSYNQKHPSFYLLFFFSRKNCPPCLQQVINCLNELREKVKVFGVVKEEEIQFIDEIKYTWGIKFPIKTIKNWNKFRPNYGPTLYGVDSDGRIYFILPCIGLEENYLNSYLDEFARKVGRLLYLKS